MTPLVSIIIPTYKRKEALLERAVFSALNQTYQNIEVVIVDDNGREDLSSYRDNVKRLIEGIQQKDNRVKLILNKNNIGGALSRNEGVKNASGKYMTFLDDDDEFLPEKVSHQVAYMLDSGVNVSFTDLSIYNEKDKVIDRRTRDEIKSFDKKDLLKYHIMKNLTGTETFMIEKIIFEKVGGFDNVKVGHEFFLMYKLLLLDESSFGYFPSDDIKAYRTAEESISNGPNKIIGEKENYKFKKQFFKDLKLSERRYIKCRHRAVLAISYKRRKRYVSSLWYLTYAFLTAPVLSIKEAHNRKK